jgi:hypothetical protein
MVRILAEMYHLQSYLAIHPHQRSIGSRDMPTDLALDRRRSTRVRLNVAIEAQGVAEPLKCEGETAVVNLHGAFISTAIPLRVGMIVDIFVVATGKCARATVVYVNREQPQFCGLALEQSQNVWGITLPPADWPVTDSEGASE